MVRSGLGDAAAITPWDKHMATGPHVPAAEHWATATWLPGGLKRWQICHSYHGDAAWVLMGFWYRLCLWLCCGVKMGMVTHGCSSRGLALWLNFKPTGDGGFPWMRWLCGAVQWVVCSAVLLGKGTCHLPCYCSCWSFTLPSWCLRVSGESWTSPGRSWNAFAFVLSFGLFCLESCPNPLQPAAAGVCEWALTTLGPPVSNPEHGCFGLTGLRCNPPTWDCLHSSIHRLFH